MQYSKIPKIVIDGTSEKAGRSERFTVFIGGKRVMLQGRSFRVFTMLALAARLGLNNGGCVHGMDLSADGATQAIYVLRKDLAAAAKGDYWLEQWAAGCLSSDRRGWWKLDARPDRIVIPPELAERFQDAMIGDMMGMLAQGG